MVESRIVQARTALGVAALAKQAAEDAQDGEGSGADGEGDEAGTPGEARRSRRGPGMGAIAEEGDGQDGGGADGEEGEEQYDDKYAVHKHKGGRKGKGEEEGPHGPRLARFESWEAQRAQVEALGRAASPDAQAALLERMIAEALAEELAGQRSAAGGEVGRGSCALAVAVWRGSACARLLAPIPEGMQEPCGPVERHMHLTPTHTS